MVFTGQSNQRRHVTKLLVVIGLVSWVTTFECPTAVADVKDSGKVYYVRNTGDDENNGESPERAFATIQHAVNECRGSGNTIYVAPGVYTESVEIGIGQGIKAGKGESSSPNRIIGDFAGRFIEAGSGPITIDGENRRAFGFKLQKTKGWAIQGLVLKNQTTHGIYANECDDTIIDDLTIHVPRYFAIYVLRGENLIIEDVDLIRTPTTGHGIWTSYTSGQITIERNRLSLTNADYLSLGYKDGYSRYRRQNRRYRFVYGIIAIGDYRNLNNSTRQSKEHKNSSIVIQNNVVSDAWLGIYTVNYGADDQAFISNNSVSGCYYGLFGYGYRGSVLLSDNIVTDSYIAAGAYSLNGGGAMIRGLLTNNIKRHPVTYVYGSDATQETVLEDRDPLWTNPSIGDFSLAFESPAVDAATGAFYVATDIRMVARPYNATSLDVARSDYGAYEFDPTVDHASTPHLVQWHEDEPGG